MISGKILRDAIISGANNINNQRSRVDELNVFPVPDGDEPLVLIAQVLYE